VAGLKGKFEFAKLGPWQALWFAKEALEALRSTKRIGGDWIFQVSAVFFQIYSKYTMFRWRYFRLRYWITLGSHKV
jgi:hypothetical protein